VYFDHFNALGSDTQWTDYAGRSGKEEIFYPWGVEWQDTGFGGYQTFGSLILYDPSTDGYVTPNRYFVSTQGRWLSPDPLAGSMLNPQSLNRYAYVLNNPCSMVDPLGLDSCNFNISIVNLALAAQDLTSVESQIKALFAASSVGQAISVGVNFEFSGNAAYMLFITSNGVPGVSPGGYSSGGSGVVFANIVPGNVFNLYFDRVLGVEATHEIGHGLGIRDLQFSVRQGSTLMSVDTNPAYGVPELSPVYSSDFPAGLLFTPQQVAALFRKCSKDVAKGKASFGGGGSAGGPVGGSGTYIFVVTGGWCDPENGGCSTTGYWAGPFFPQQK
jgi:RHS repeat-associated protein